MPKHKKGKASGTKRKVKSGGKKKARKIKSSKNSKLTKLELQVQKYRSCVEKYNELIRRAETWMGVNKELLFDLLHFLKSHSTTNITYDDFKAALMTMEAPFAKIEIHIITLLYDSNKDGFIELEDFTESPITLSLREGTSGEDKKEKINSNDRGNHTQLTTPEIKLFLSSDEDPESQLNPETMLTDLNLEAGSEWEPIDIEIYYRPAGKYTSGWPNSSLSELTNLENDPVLWSKLIADNMLYETLIGKETNTSETYKCNLQTGLAKFSAKLVQDVKQEMSSLRI